MDTQYETLQSLEINSLDRENLLESLTLELMTDNIINQISGDNISSTDFLYIVVEKFSTILKEDIIEDEDKVEVQHQMINFCDNLLCTIAEKYNIAVDMVKEDYVTYISVLSTLYNFLILNKYANVETFLINYINNNKQQLLETLDIADKSKDVVTISNRRKNIIKDNIALLSNINAVIDFIVGSGIIDNETFIDTIDDGELYVSRMRELYDDNTICGDFVPSLLNQTIGLAYDDAEFSRIRNSIRVQLSSDIIEEED